MIFPKGAVALKTVCTILNAAAPFLCPENHEIRGDARKKDKTLYFITAMIDKIGQWCYTVFRDPQSAESKGVENI